MFDENRRNRVPSTKIVPARDAFAEQKGGSPTRFGISHRARLRATGLCVLVLVGGGIVAGVIGTSGQSKALPPLKGKRGNPSVAVGPGPVTTVLRSRPYQLELRLMPNRAALPGTVSVKLLKAGRPVNGARVKLTFSMLEMDMGQLSGLLPQTAPGRYAHAGPVLGMGGRWGLRFDVAPPGAKPFSVTVVDRIGA
jgi:hypothetical protein